MAGRAGDRETAAFPLVEAILVALLILSAVLFFTLTQRPSGEAKARGIDLGSISTDTLAILQRKTFTDPDGGTLTLEQWVNRTMAGDADVADTVQEFLDEVLPTGARYEVRLNNGVGSIVLLPQPSTVEPNGASAAEVPFFPNWKKFKGNTTTGTAAPGQEVTNIASQFSVFTFGTSGTIQCIKGPNGVSAAPEGSTWLSYWRTNAPRVDGGVTFYRVPDGMPYGIWAGYTDAACTTGVTYARIAHPGGTATDYPLYGLQLVIWFGA